MSQPVSDKTSLKVAMVRSRDQLLFYTPLNISGTSNFVCLQAMSNVSLLTADHS